MTDFTSLRNSTSLRILREARVLISNPSRWTQGVAAQDAEGRKVPTCDPRAVKWCLRGALSHAEGAPRYPCPQPHVITGIGRQSITGFNDTHSHAEVLEVLDRAIELAEAE